MDKWEIESPEPALETGAVWGYGVAWEKPCPKENHTEAFSVNGQKVYVRDVERLNGYLKRFTEPEWEYYSEGATPGFRLAFLRNYDQERYQDICMGDGF